MKNKFFLTLSLSVVFLCFYLVGFSQTYIQFISSGTQNYCYNSVPGGTFALKLTGGNCSNWIYSWVNITGNGCSSNEPITQYISYPTQTTTYRCDNIDTGAKYYFTITVYNISQIDTVDGDYCCANGGTVTLDGSILYGTPLYVKYRLYRNGVYTGTETSGTGSAINWTVTSTGTYTVKAHFLGCEKQMYGSAVISHYCCKGTSGFNEETEISSIKVFPNPSTGSLFIETGGIGEYYLYNEIGQVVKQIQFTLINERKEINGLKPGLYYLKNKNGSIENSTKITVVE